MKKWFYASLIVLLSQRILPHTQEHIQDEVYRYATTRVGGILFVIDTIFLPLEKRIPNGFKDLEHLPYKFWSPIRNPWKNREMRVVMKENEAEIGDVVYSYSSDRGIKLRLLLPPGKFPEGAYYEIGISRIRVRQQLEGVPWVSYYDPFTGEAVYKRFYDEEVLSYWNSLTLEEKKLSAICAMISTAAQNINSLLTEKHPDEFHLQLKSFLIVPPGRRTFDTDVLKMQFMLAILDWMNPYTGQPVKEVSPAAPMLGDYSLFVSHQNIVFAIGWNVGNQPVFPIWQYKTFREYYESGKSESLWQKER